MFNDMLAMGSGGKKRETLQLIKVSSASASSIYSSDYVAMNAFDGTNHSKGWVYGSQTGNWLKADLGSAEDIKGIVCGFVGGVPTYDYNTVTVDISYSSDDVTYSTPETFTLEGITNYFSNAFFPVNFNARYVKFSFSNINNWGVKISILG